MKLSELAYRRLALYCLIAGFVMLGVAVISALMYSPRHLVVVESAPPAPAVSDPGVLLVDAREGTGSATPRAKVASDGAVAIRAVPVPAVQSAASSAPIVQRRAPNRAQVRSAPRIPPQPSPSHHPTPPPEVVKAPPPPVAAPAPASPVATPAPEPPPTEPEPIEPAVVRPPPVQAPPAEPPAFEPPTVVEPPAVRREIDDQDDQDDGDEVVEDADDEDGRGRGRGRGN